MATILTRTPVEPEGGAIDLDFRETDNWTRYSGIPSLSLLFGDPEAGPYVFLSASEPMVDQMPTGFAHAHASDNWRISVRGTTNMGRDAYTHGEFRFHDGGVPYASDNLAWGPDGGFGLVLMGDRRGFAIQPVKAAIAEQVEPSQAKAARAMGVERLDPCPGAPAIRTTEGPTARAHRNGGFNDTSGWRNLGDGRRLYVGLLGEPERGPVICLIDADPGVEAWPERCLDTETMIVPIDGSVQVGETVLEQGSLRIESPGVPAAPLVAGDAGVQLVAVIGDRRAVLAGDGFSAGAIGRSVTAQVEELLAELAA